MKIKALEDSSNTFTMLEEQGITPIRETDMAIPQMPYDITDLDDSDLMRLFSHLTAYSNFLNVQLSCALVDERAAEREVSVNKATTLINNMATSDDKITVARAKLMDDPKIVELNDVYEERHAYRKIIEVMANNSERDMNLISRELTRRTASDSYKTRSRGYTT
jgi:hypothetical protein